MRCGLAILTSLMLFTGCSKAPVPVPLNEQARAHEAALKSLKETQDQVNMMKAHGIK